jgi:hypothetical protein
MSRTEARDAYRADPKRCRTDAVYKRPLGADVRYICHTTTEMTKRSDNSRSLTRRRPNDSR